MLNLLCSLQLPPAAAFCTQPVKLPTESHLCARVKGAGSMRSPLQKQAARSSNATPTRTFVPGSKAPASRRKFFAMCIATFSRNLGRGREERWQAHASCSQGEGSEARVEIQQDGRANAGDRLQELGQRRREAKCRPQQCDAVPAGLPLSTYTARALPPSTTYAPPTIHPPGTLALPGPYCGTRRPCCATLWSHRGAM